LELIKCIIIFDGYFVVIKINETATLITLNKLHSMHKLMFRCRAAAAAAADAKSNESEIGEQNWSRNGLESRQLSKSGLGDCTV
jgi:hypothetical protein